MAYKYFIPGRRAPGISGGEHGKKDLLWLRTEFPGCQYMNGKHKGQDGVFILQEHNADYGERIDSAEYEGAVFWPPAGEINIKQYKRKDPILAFEIQLYCGETITIVPAVCEPQKLLFGKVNQKEEVIPVASQYNKASKYGKLAYELIYKIQDGQTQVTDNLVLAFVEETIKYSYMCPIDLMNCWGKVSHQDIEGIMMAGLGSHPESIQKKVESDT